jgi:hypothetical protein
MKDYLWGTLLLGEVWVTITLIYFATEGYWR